MASSNFVAGGTKASIIGLSLTNQGVRAWLKGTVGLGVVREDRKSVVKVMDAKSKAERQLDMASFVGFVGKATWSNGDAQTDHLRVLAELDRMVERSAKANGGEVPSDIVTVYDAVKAHLGVQKLGVPVPAPVAVVVEPVVVKAKHPSNHHFKLLDGLKGGTVHTLLGDARLTGWVRLTEKGALSIGFLNPEGESRMLGADSALGFRFYGNEYSSVKTLARIRQLMAGQIRAKKAKATQQA